MTSQKQNCVIISHDLYYKIRIPLFDKIKVKSQCCQVAAFGHECQVSHILNPNSIKVYSHMMCISVLVWLKLNSRLSYPLSVEINTGGGGHDF